MLLQINPHSPVPIYRQIMDQIRYQILAGVIKESQKLPSVRDLSRSIKVNPMTVSKSYAYLEMEGLLDRKRGVGVFAAKLNDEQKKTNCRMLVERGLEQIANDAISLGLSKEQFIQMADGVFNDLKTEE
jgi:GntR family transcriptional regulator